MENKKTANVLMINMGALILLEIVVSILNFDTSMILHSLCPIISLAFIALYGFVLYKKPHGNMLKYAMLILAASEILNVSQCLTYGYGLAYLHVVRLFVAGIIIYVSGRLNRIEQNKTLLSVATVVSFILAIWGIIYDAGSIDTVNLITFLVGPISLLTLLFAYFVRFKAHKEAGIADAPKA